MFEELKILKEKYGITVCDEYAAFITNTNMFDYTGKIINVQNVDYEINHFLKKSDSSSADLRTWYLLLEPEQKDYLTIAFCIYDEEIAIKVKGDELGKVVLILRSHDDDQEDATKIYDIAENFSDFLKMIQ